MSILQDILNEMAWDEGLAMPVANSENKDLENRVQSLQGKIGSNRKDLNQTQDRLTAVIEHMRNVRQELQQTQNLLNSRKKELESENHMFKISEREEGRINQEVNRIAKLLEELTDKKNSAENNAFRLTQKMEELRSQMKWDQQALEAWLEESAQKDEDAMALQKYARLDEMHVKELSLRIEKMTSDRDDRRKRLDHETTEMMTCQLELDKTAEHFRKSHQERQQLIEQWETTIKQMARRDREMDLLASQIARAKGELRNKEDQIQDEQTMLENQQRNNEELEMKIGSSERSAARMKLDLQDQEAARSSFKSELDALKRTVDRTAVELEQTRGHVTRLKKEKVEKTSRLKGVENDVKNLNEKLELAAKEQLSAEESAAEMDKLLTDEDKAQRELEYRLEKMRSTEFKRAQEVFDSKQRKKTVASELHGSESALKNLISRISQLDHEALKQQELLYNQEFTLQQLERRLNRMSGEHSSEERLMLESKVRELTQALDEKNGIVALLENQMKYLSDDIRRVRRDVENHKTARTDLELKIQELNNHNENSQKEVKKLTRKKQDKMVDENLMKLEVKRLRSVLYDRADKVLSLEKRKLQLETSVRERSNEINIHKDMLKSQIRAADDERQQVSSELHERISKIDKLQKRFEILTVSMAPPEGEEEHSQAYYVIKAAQEKEELQRQGDQLDAQIHKAEKELRALENTCRVLNARNETYRKGYKKVTETSEETDEKLRLDEQHRHVIDKLKLKKRQLREMQEDLDMMRNNLEMLHRDDSAYTGLVVEKEKRVKQAKKEIEDQRVKLDRIAVLNARASREIRSKQNTKAVVPEERDMELRDLRDFNRTIMRQTAEYSSGNGEAGAIISMYFSQSGIPLPSGSTPGSSRVSSRVSSRASSIMSGRGSARSSISSKGEAAGASPAMVTIGEEHLGQLKPSGRVPSGKSIGSSKTKSTGR